MNAKVVLLPRDLKPEDVAGRTVIVFDVLRATTTITAALAAGVAEVRVFADLDEAKESAAAFSGPKILCGEVKALPPPGFDLGNSPRQWTADHAGKTVFLCTTNGTRALAAAAAMKAAAIFAGALVNSAAAARAAVAEGRDVTLLCAGSDGGESLEDVLGAASVLENMKAGPSDAAADTALRLYSRWRGSLPTALRLGAGGVNVIRAGLEPDIDFCASVDSIPVVGRLGSPGLTIRRAES